MDPGGKIYTIDELDVGKSRILTMRGLTKTRTKRKDTALPGRFAPESESIRPT